MKRSISTPDIKNLVNTDVAPWDFKTSSKLPEMKSFLLEEPNRKKVSNQDVGPNFSNEENDENIPIKEDLNSVKISSDPSIKFVPIITDQQLNKWKEYYEGLSERDRRIKKESLGETLDSMYKDKIILHKIEWENKSIEEVHSTYDSYRNHLHKLQKMNMYKVFMIIFWTITQIIMKRMGVDSTGYVQMQLKSSDKYQHILYDICSEHTEIVNGTPTSREWSPMEKLLYNSALTAVCVVLINYAKTIGGPILGGIGKDIIEQIAEWLSPSSDVNLGDVEMIQPLPGTNSGLKDTVEKLAGMISGGVGENQDVIYED